MKPAILGLLTVGFIAVPTFMVKGWVRDAGDRLVAAPVEADTTPVAVADAADEDYCTPELKVVLRRVLSSCGLLKTGEVRGCQPLAAEKVATVGGSDFNALFMPMAERAGIVEFDSASSKLDMKDEKLIKDVFSDQRGASYFFVVARASPDGAVSYNRKLSENRAKAVLDYLQTSMPDPDLNDEVGLLWLGEEYAQLEQRFCDWRRSDGKSCEPGDLNRSAFITWVDCTL